MSNEQNREKSKAVPEIDEISILKTTIRNIESLVPSVPEDKGNPLPRHQNKMQPEKTKDMYFGGLMTE